MKAVFEEMSNLEADPPDFCISSGPIADNFFHCQAAIIGPPNSPYYGGIFHLTIDFPPEYPLQPPKILFTTRIYHPNIDAKDGSINLDYIKHWTPITTISKILIMIGVLLCNPNWEDPLVPDIARIYETDSKRYEQLAREWTLEYAT